MRWIDLNGYIITGIQNNQYNFENQTWSDYHVGETKPYDCGRCHTTGWVASDDGDASNNQDGLEGMLGTFFAGGVHCEQCHGESDVHVSNPSNYNMTIDNSSAFCSGCHTRDPDNHIAASAGFIKHHEQYDEWLHSPHTNGPGCNTCHDPHASVKFDDSASGNGTLLSCEGCHPDQTAFSAHNALPECTDCHMPKASKSAVALSAYQGDIPTHIWSINTDPVDRFQGMFTENGSMVREDIDGQAQITLDFACYGCHRDENGDGGSSSTKTLAELSERAFNMHGTLSNVDPSRVPDMVALTGAYPFNPMTNITFSVTEPQHVSISVYDMAGQQVALLSHQVYTIGEYTTGWNGKSIQGRNVASGTYLVNVKAGGSTQSLKIQLVR